MTDSHWVDNIDRRDGEWHFRLEEVCGYPVGLRYTWMQKQYVHTQTIANKFTSFSFSFEPGQVTSDRTECRISDSWISETLLIYMSFVTAPTYYCNIAYSNLLFQIICIVEVRHKNIRVIELAFYLQ